MLNLSQYFIKKIRPYICNLLTRIFYAGSRVKIGRYFRADSIPRIIVDKGCELIIEKGVVLRRNVEIRVHGRAKVILRSNVRIDRGVRILATNTAIVELKDGARLGLYSVLNGGDSILIGRKALVSGFVYLQTSMHSYGVRGKYVQEQGYSHSPVTLEDDVWLGTHVVVLPGVIIGTGAVVGSNAVVTKSINAYKVVAGIPAKILKDRE